MADLAGDGATVYAARLQAALRDPMFTDLDLPKLHSEDVATNFPGMTEAFLRLYTAYQEEQLALADRDAETPRGGDGNARRTDAVAEARRFLRSEEHTSELQSLMRISYAVFCLKKKTLNILIDY